MTYLEREKLLDVLLDLWRRDISADEALELIEEILAKVE